MNFDTNHNFEISNTAPERKAGISSPPSGEYDDFRHAFEEFRSANDERLASLERGRGDVLLEEKVDRINSAIDAHTRRLDDLALRQARPAIEGRSRVVSDAAGREHKSAFDSYVRGGDAGGLRQIETKAMSVGTNADGGYLVPVEIEHDHRRTPRSDLADPRASPACARFRQRSTRSRS